jgi:thiol-disulfide isomerase/thioredoxin
MRIKVILAIIIALSLVTGGSSNVEVLAKDGGFSFPRTCIAELETATWCGFCPRADRALYLLGEEEYDEDRFVVISHHYNDSLSQENSTARMHEYGTIATPTCIFNGNSFVQGGDVDVKDKYKKMIDFQLQKTSPFLIHLKGEVQEDFLKLTAYVLAWNDLPDDLNYTFVICEKDTKSGGRSYRWVCRDVKPEASGTSFTMDKFSVKKFELNWNIPKGVDWKKLYGAFLIESFDSHDIYQAGIWRKNKFQVEKFDTPLGQFFKESPKELKITFSNYKILNKGEWDLIDEEGMVYPSSGEMERSTLTIKPNSPLPYGKKYCVYIHSGRGSVGTASTFLQSPAFLHFQIGEDPTPPPPPKDPPSLSLSTLGIDMGLVDEDSQKTFEFQITNEGDEELSGEISVDCGWISFENSSFSGIIDDQYAVSGIIDTSNLDPGLKHTGTINISSNGGNGKIGLKLELPLSPPVLKVDHTDLVFDEGNIDKTAVLKITNLGQAELIGTLEVIESWIKVNIDEFTGETELEVSVDTSSLEAGKYLGEINIESNGGFVKILVTVIVPKKVTKIELMYGSKLAVVDGEIKEMRNEPYISSNGTIMIEAVSVAEFGVAVTTVGTAVTFMYNGNFITVTAGYKNIVFNSEVFELSYFVVLIERKLYVPSDILSIISENKIELTIKGEPVLLPESKPDPLTIELIVNSKTATVNGKKIELEMAPTIIDGRTMVPLRFVTETFGFEVGWNGDTKEITLTKGSLVIILKSGEKNVMVARDGTKENVVSDPAPTIMDGHTMVPIRFFSEILSAEIDWIGEEKKIVIVYQP